MGKVVHKNGKPYTLGGSISFRHETKEGVSTEGTIDPDGAFVLQTVTAHHNVSGALEGSHAVTIVPPAPDQNVVPIRLAKTYVVVAGDNNLTIELED